MAYADYTFYSTEWLGTAIAEADFPRLALRASDFIDYYTRGKAAASDATTALAKACCAIAEQMQEDEKLRALAARSVDAALDGNGEVKSETVGSWSKTYATASDYAGNADKTGATALRAQYARIADEYLVNTGLLYRGGCHL